MRTGELVTGDAVVALLYGVAARIYGLVNCGLVSWRLVTRWSPSLMGGCKVLGIGNWEPRTGELVTGDAVVALLYGYPQGLL